MITKSFSVDIPKVMFKKMYVDDYCKHMVTEFLTEMTKNQMQFSTMLLIGSGKNSG